MDTAEIQKRLDAMPAAMSAKGLRMPKAEFSLNGNEQHRVWLKCAKTPDSFYSDRLESIRADAIPEMLDAADQWIADMPSIEEAKLAEFTALLASTIELGHANGIDVQFVNPLTEAMKRLSENALTYRVAA